MSTRTGPARTPVENANEVRLLGRVSRAPSAVALPSGDQLVTFRVSVDRAGAGRSARQRVDSVPCCAWTARVRRSALTWRVGDIVELRGAVHCRFFRTPRGLGSRVEVEVSSAKLIRRAPVA